MGEGRGERGGVGEEGEIRFTKKISLNKLNLQLFTFTFILLISDFYGISSVQSVAGHC